jgi:hypothetical protein
MDAAIKLRDDVAKGYDVAPGAVRVFHCPLGKIDLNEVVMEQAEALAALGVLVAKSAAKKETKAQDK